MLCGVCGSPPESACFRKYKDEYSQQAAADSKQKVYLCVLALSRHTESSWSCFKQIQDNYNSLLTSTFESVTRVTRDGIFSLETES